MFHTWCTLSGQVDKFKLKLQAACGSANQQVHFIRDARVNNPLELSQEQMQDAKALLVALTRRAICANEGRKFTHRGNRAWGKHKQAECAVM